MNKASAGDKFVELVEILSRLRGDGGCPWDREQDETTIVDYFLEEVYEAVDALRQGNISSFAEELGDVVMEVVFFAQIFKEKNAFDITDVLEGINKKMIRRHPHVFGEKSYGDSARVAEEWARQKTEEKEGNSVLEGLVQHAPALLNAFQIGVKASSYGFDWPDAGEAFGKIEEESGELREAMNSGEEKEVFHEMGDLLFAAANVSRLLGINPELALKEANNRFVQRFRSMEEALKAGGRRLGEVPLDEMDKVWESVKGESEDY